MTKIGAHIELYVLGFYPKLVSDGISCGEIDKFGYEKLIEFKKSSSKKIIFVKSIEINTNGRLMFSNLTWVFYSNDIKIKLVGDCSCMFYGSKFNNDIGAWDVLGVTSMSCMFYSSKFNHDISAWDTHSVTNMRFMFSNSKFNQDISRWDISSVIHMSHMFSNSKFKQDISRWDTSSVISHY